MLIRLSSTLTFSLLRLYILSYFYRITVLGLVFFVRCRRASVSVAL